MDSSSQLKLGYITYLNCVPFFHYLKENGFCGRFVAGVPSELNQMLQQGQLDASPSSSFEYARNWRKYLILPGHSISSIGKVKSVLLFSPVPLNELSGRTVALTGESATSINLLRIIFREFYHLDDVTDVVPDTPIEDLIRQHQPALLIGDRALRLASNLPQGMHVLDLGTIWYQHTGLPFVFALWMVDRRSLGAFSDAFAGLAQQLQNSCRQLIEDPLPLAKVLAHEVGIEADAIVDYWQTIDYRLTGQNLQGLQLFFQLCVKHHLLEEQPELNFLD